MIKRETKKITNLIKWMNGVSLWAQGKLTKTSLLNNLI